MKVRFVVEADTTMFSLTAWSTKATPEGFLQMDDCLFVNSERESFFGALNAVCVSRGTMTDAPKIKLPSASDLDAVAAEQETAERTK